MPALEATACGTPVLTAEGGAVAEVVGNAGLTFDPYEPQAIADCILRLLSEPQTHAELSRAAPEAARRHGWERAGQLALGALERIVAGS